MRRSLLILNPGRSIAGPRFRARSTEDGFSLLEVILALAILTGALAVVGELTRSALRSAESARDQTRAQFLCESKLAEITSGAVMAESVTDVPCETDPEFLYSMALYPADMEGLLIAEIAVYRPGPRQARSHFQLSRWIQDPALAYSAAAEAAESSSVTATDSTVSQ